ncbi:hypothetical protein Ndes2526A_g03954 [Nannochloris sp. 'desiccata']
MKEWARLQLDVVFIQEHHISGLVHEMELGLSRRGWKAFWAFNNVGGGSSSGSSTSGVLIVVKRNLVTSGALKIAENSLKIWGPDDGRCLSINADWRGHKLQLASIYMPNDAASQKIFIESRLAPMKTAAGQRLTLWGGDFNFVHNPNLDRLSKRAAVPGEVPGMYRPPETEHTVGKFWCDQLPSVSDIWRHRHPTGRMMTHFGGRSAARLDRFYIGDDGTAYAGVNSRIQRPRRENGSFLSDHCPVVMELAQKIIEGDRGASFAPRLRMYFASENDLVTEFITWLASKKAHMPINYKARLKWWRRLKRDISRKVFRLNGIQRARQRAPVAVLREELEELYTFIEGSDPLAAATSLAALPEARQAVAAAEEALEDVFQLKQKRDWIHNHERPTRALTGQLNPKKHQGVSALRAANGEIVGTSIGCARVVTTHCAAVSAKPTTTNAAQNLVLDAMERQDSPVLDSGRAEVLGSVVVTEQEVLVALRRSKPGKAPGRDGIPVELYKKFKTQFVPILAEFTGEVSVDWQEMKNRVAGKLAKISRLNLSCFGRAFSVNSYALGTFLYHAEFAGLQQDNELEKWIAAVVDRSQGPPPGRGFAGVAAVNLVGHPKEGAFGLMPLAEHVKARAARWPLRLVTEDLACPTPWVRVARALVQRALAGTQTKYDKRLFMLSPPRGEAAGYPHNYPKLVRKILQVVATLPVATVLDESEWQPGPWCHVMPLWGNPMLQSDTGKGGYEFSEAGCYFRECPWQTLGELLKARTQIQQWSQQEWQQHGSTFATYIGYYGLGTQRGDALEKIEEFLNYLNKPAWILAAEAAESALTQKSGL